MSWALPATAVLVGALLAGFRWYERQASGTRMLALVATLAALAVLGRIAFAPIPNVKPTTDIVLIAGYVLGGAPGFAVGAVAALASNLVFGQGPWTPWQMGAWGLCGMVGAGLAVVSRRSLGRWPLALACAAAGLMFGAIMDVQTWLTATGTQSLAGYAAVSATSLPYNLAHAGGNLAFCLAFGPALVRALARYRTRLTVEWVPLPASGTGGSGGPARVGATLLAALVLAGGVLALGTPATAQAASPAAYLLAAQNRDGGWGGAPRERSSPLISAWAVMGLASAGRACPGRAARYLAAAAVRNTTPGDLERSVLALRACGRPARDARGRVLTTVLRRAQRGDGSWSGIVNPTAFGIFALRAAGASPRDRAVRRAGAFLVRQIGRDGGFSSVRGGASGIDDTAAALQGLVASGYRSSRTARRATAYLRRQQQATGGFPLVPGSGPNAQSTAWAIQAFASVGVDPGRVRTRGSRSASSYLRTLVQGNGLVRYSRTSAQTPVWVTGQALTGLAARPFPAAARRAR